MPLLEPIALKSAVQAMLDSNSPLHLQIERLPLAVYREIVAHIQQLDGLEVTLRPQKSTEFDYLQSQVGGLTVALASPQPHNDPATGDRLTQILTHYASRFGPWLQA